MNKRFGARALLAASVFTGLIAGAPAFAMAETGEQAPRHA